MKPAEKKLNNAGFSLVELIIAVVILGIVVTPLLHSFITSAGTTRRAYIVGEATLAAQNIAEKIEANGIDAVMGAPAVLGTGAVAKYADAEWSSSPLPAYANHFKVKVPNISVSNGTMSAMVEFEADPGNYHNSQNMAEYSNMDAVFAQAVLDPSFPDPDDICKNKFELATVNPTVSRIERTVTLKVKNEGNLLNAELEFSYYYSYTEPAPDDEPAATQHKTVSYSYSILNDYNYEVNEIPNIYLMLYPFVKGEDPYRDAEKVDIININNKVDNSSGAIRHDLDKFRVFLVRENRNTDGDNNSNYNCEIHLIQDYDSRVLNGNYNDYVFSDVFSNFLRGDVNKRGNVSIKVHFGSNIYGALNFANGDELVAMTPKKDRIYDVTITVYPTDDFTGDPLYHLNEKILK